MLKSGPGFLFKGDGFEPIQKFMLSSFTKHQKGNQKIFLDINNFISIWNYSHEIRMKIIEFPILFFEQ